MPVKVTIGSQEQPKEPKAFPKVMKSKVNDILVFFEKEGKGQVLIGDFVTNPGVIEDNWNMDVFEDFTEPITIQTV